MSKPLISSTKAGAASSATPVTTYAVGGTMLLHAVFLVGLSWIEVGGLSNSSQQPAQLQLRQGEQVVQLKLRPMTVPITATTSEANPAPSPTPTPTVVSKQLPAPTSVASFNAPDAAPIMEKAKTAVRAQAPDLRQTQTIPVAHATSKSIHDRPAHSNASTSASTESTLHPKSITLERPLTLPTIEPQFDIVTEPAQPKTSPTASVRPAGVTRGINIKSLPHPKYPSLSRRKGEAGTVVVEVEVLADGSVGQLRVLRSPGFSRLVAAALDAARQGQFQPARQNGMAVRSRISIPFQFVLK